MRAAHGGQRLPSRLGSWEPVRLIAEGQLSLVYLARPAGGSAGQPACHALKVLRSEWQDDPRGLAILAREVQVGRSVAHPAPGADSGGRPIGSALLRGDAFARRSVACRLFAIARDDRSADRVLNRAASGRSMEALHEAGWMHGDVKPRNVVVSSSGHVTLIDLGFARHRNERSDMADRPVMGTLRYVAPEMLYTAEGGDAQSDVYSLGVTLFEMLTGRVPFDAEDVAELAAQHRQELPGDLRSLLPHLPTPHGRLVHHMLAKQPLRRPCAPRSSAGSWLWKSKRSRNVILSPAHERRDHTGGRSQR